MLFQLCDGTGMRFVVDVIVQAKMIEKRFDTSQDINWFLAIKLRSILYCLMAEFSLQWVSCFYYVWHYFQNAVMFVRGPNHISEKQMAKSCVVSLAKDRKW